MDQKTILLNRIPTSNLFTSKIFHGVLLPALSKRLLIVWCTLTKFANRMWHCCFMIYVAAMWRSWKRSACFHREYNCIARGGSHVESCGLIGSCMSKKSSLRRSPGVSVDIWLRDSGMPDDGALMSSNNSPNKHVRRRHLSGDTFVWGGAASEGTDSLTNSQGLKLAAGHQSSLPSVSCLIFSSSSLPPLLRPPTNPSLAASQKLSWGAVSVSASQYRGDISARQIRAALQLIWLSSPC